MREFKDVLEKLAEMSPDDMAAHFDEHQILGVRGVSSKCAVARYIEKETGHRTIAGANWICLPGRTGLEHPPTTVVQFIRNFDLGRYPEISENHSMSGKLD